MIGILSLYYTSPHSAAEMKNCVGHPQM